MTPHCEVCKKPIRIKFGHDDLMPHGGWCMCLSEAARKAAAPLTPTGLDALIERKPLLSIDDDPSGIATTWMNAAAAALVQLRDSEALARGTIAEQMIEIERLRSAPLPGVSAVRRFSCFQTEDGVYEHAAGQHVEYKDYRAMQIARDDLQHDANRINCARWKAEAEVERAFQMLAVYGVPQERARTVGNGIEVLMQRMNKERMAIEARIAALEAEREGLQGECERLSDAVRLATIDLAGVAELQRDSRRLHWLHSQASCKPDIQGCEWGIWRVSWEGGRASHVWATNSDFSDLDAAMKLAEDYAAIDAARSKP